MAQASSAPTPSTSVDPMRPAWVTGTIGPGTGERTQETRIVDGVESWFVRHIGLPIEMDDPRLTGIYSQVFTNVVHPVSGEAEIWVSRGETRIENEGGSWEGTAVGMERSAPHATIGQTDVLVGSGAYEGLTAYLVSDWGTWPARVTGAIFPGDMPPVVTFEELPEE
jgi:hypothetical protein